VQNRRGFGYWCWLSAVVLGAGTACSSGEALNAGSPALPGGEQGSAPDASTPATTPGPSLSDPEPGNETPGALPPLVVDRADAGGTLAGEEAAATSDAGVGPAGVTTRGTGGPVGPAELTSSAGLLFRIDAREATAARGLLVLLHGSTASNYETFVPMMQDVAERYGLIPVSVLAPNGQGWNEGDQVRAAELLHALIQDDLYTQYDIDPSRVVFSGQSSGGGFLSSNFVPAHARDYGGGAFFQCGAAPPNIAFSPDAETRESFRLHFEITTEDPIWPDSYAAALRAYRAVEMSLTEDSTKPGGHCQFDQQQVILDHIDAVLGG
jgi:predicted esterase